MPSEKEKPFIEDVYKKSLLHARLIRAGDQCGKVLSIRIPDEILTEPGFYTADASDIPGDRFIVVDGDQVPLFASDEITYPGQPVMIAAHKDQRRLKELCEQILIEVDPVEPFILGEKIPDAQLLKGRVAAELRQSKGNGDKLIANAATRIEKSYSTGMQEHFYSGRQEVLIEPLKESLVVTGSTEWSHLIRRNVASVLNRPHREILVQSARKSPSFGGKLWFPALLAAQASIIAITSAKPVRLVLSKEEDIRYTTKRAPVLIRRISAMNEEKELVAQKSEVYIDGGAFPVFTQVMMESAVAAESSLSMKPPGSVTVKVIKTSRPSMDFFSGTGVAPILFATQRHEDHLAASVAEEPAAWRMKSLSQMATRGGLVNLIEECCKASDYSRKWIAYGKQSRAELPLKTLRRERGIGLSTGFQGNGLIHKSYRDPKYSIEMKMFDNESAVLYTSAIPSTHSTSNIWKETAAAALGISTRQISVINSSTEAAPNSGPPFLYNHLFAINDLIIRGAEKLKKAAKKGDFPISVEQTMSDLPAEESESRPFRGTTLGCAVVEVEVNPVSREIEPIKITVTINSGKVHHPRYARQRLRTAIIQTLNWITKPANAGTGDERIEMALVLPPKLPVIDIRLVENEASSPKGITELIFNMLPAAFVAAASQASGAELNSIPIRLSREEEDS